MFQSLKKSLTFAILKLMAYVPYQFLPFLGWLLGWLTYLLSRKNADLIRDNLQNSRLCNSESEYKKVLNENIKATGFSLLESLHLWLKPHEKSLALVRQCTGWEHVETALKAGKGIIFLTPHLGCYEITSLYYGAHHPMAVLYRPPRQSWLLPLIKGGRERGKITLAPANAHGVKQLLRSLKRGEAIGMLPDQAPLSGEGEWAPFFGRPAYTMTLASKLAEKTGAQVLMAFGERLAGGHGYDIHIEPIHAGGISTPALLNLEMERTIARCPSQYLWMYDRYKVRNNSLQKRESPIS